MKAESQRVGTLDGIRAVSIFAILVYHYFDYSLSVGVIHPPDIVATLIKNLRLFMDLFFMLSGFLITRSLYNLFKKVKDGQLTRKDAGGRYFVSRTLRILPAWLIILTVTFIVYQMDLYKLTRNFYIPFFGKDDFTLLLGGSPPLQSYTELLVESLKHSWMDLFFVSNYSRIRLLVHGWSLSLEVQFYIFMFLAAFYFLFKKNNAAKVRTLLFVIIVVALVRVLLVALLPVSDLKTEESFIYTPFVMRMDVFSAGILLFVLYEFYPDQCALKPKHALWLYIFSFVMIMAALSVSLPYNDSVPAWIWYAAVRYIFSLLSFFVLFYAAIFSHTLMSKLLSSSPLSFTADISYEMYLWHIIIGVYFLPYYYRKTFGINSAFISSFGFVLYFFLVVAVSFMVRYATEHFWVQKLRLIVSRNG